MNDSKSFVIRTEDLRPEEVLNLFVPTEKDLQLIEKLKSATPLILEGSRGTGKSFLIRVSEQQQIKEFRKTNVIPVYVTFVKSSLLNTKNDQQFQYWMLVCCLRNNIPYACDAIASRARCILFNMSSPLAFQT